MIFLAGIVGLALVGAFFGWVLSQAAPPGISTFAQQGSPAMDRELLHEMAAGAMVGSAIGIFAMRRKR